MKIKTVLFVLYLLAHAPMMAQVQFVKALKDTSSKTAGTTLSITIPNTNRPTAGNSVIVTFAIDDTSAVTPVACCTDTKNNTYNMDVQYNPGTNATSARSIIFSAHNISDYANGNEGLKITVTTGSRTARVMAAAEFSGIDTGNPFDISGNNVAPGATQIQIGPPSSVCCYYSLIVYAAAAEIDSALMGSLNGTAWNNTVHMGTTGGGAASNMTLGASYIIKDNIPPDSWLDYLRLKNNGSADMSGVAAAYRSAYQGAVLTNPRKVIN